MASGAQLRISLCFCPLLPGQQNFTFVTADRIHVRLASPDAWIFVPASTGFIRDYRHSVCFPFCGSPAPDSLPAPLFALRKRAASASRSLPPALHSLYRLSRRKRAHARHSGRCYGHLTFGFSPEGLVFRLSCGHSYRSLHACMHDTIRV